MSYPPHDCDNWYRSSTLGQTSAIATFSVRWSALVVRVFVKIHRTRCLGCSVSVACSQRGGSKRHTPKLRLIPKKKCSSTVPCMISDWISWWAVVRGCSVLEVRPGSQTGRPNVKATPWVGSAGLAVSRQRSSILSHLRLSIVVGAQGIDHLCVD